jgi:uncharacterized protein (DUF2235 family)
MAALRSGLEKSIDLAFGTSVSEHVLGGYKFLMRYWAPKDEIYILGFSRGAYTARVLAEMLDHIGLLPHGNEENVDCAWKIFVDWQGWQWSEKPKETSALWKWMPFTTVPGYDEDGDEDEEDVVNDLSLEAGKDATVNSICTKVDVKPTERYTLWEELKRKPHTDQIRRHNDKKLMTKMKGFKNTFSRDIGHVRFLGLFDTVSSVPQFDHSWMGHTRFPYTPRSSAQEIWHAVSIDERRICFRPDLTYQESHDIDCHANPKRVVNEVWFAGDHSDIGGGWDRRKGCVHNSVVPLVWMVRAAKKAGVKFDDVQLEALMRTEGVVFDEKNMSPLAFSPATVGKQMSVNVKLNGPRRLGSIHDGLKGSKWWRFVQHLPIKRMELRSGEWKLAKYCRKRPRDMPLDKNMRIHRSVFERLENDKNYNPNNLPAHDSTSQAQQSTIWGRMFGYEKPGAFCSDHWELVPKTRDEDFFGQVFQMRSVEGKSSVSS